MGFRRFQMDRKALQILHKCVVFLSSISWHNTTKLVGNYFLSSFVIWNFPSKKCQFILIFCWGLGWDLVKIRSFVFSCSSWFHRLKSYILRSFEAEYLLSSAFIPCPQLFHFEFLSSSFQAPLCHFWYIAFRNYPQGYRRRHSMALYKGRIFSCSFPDYFRVSVTFTKTAVAPWANGLRAWSHHN